MIRVKKIAHATYEMPDLDKQVEYYTEILGLTLTERSKDAAYLASTVDHHSVVLRQGAAAKCTHIGFQIGPDDDLSAFERQVQGHDVKTERRRDADPTITDMVVFEDPKGTSWKCSGAASSPASGFPPRASCRTSSVTSPSTSPT